MAGLTPKAEDLVRAGRAAFRPSDADRERVFQALLPQIGGGPGAETANTPPSASTATTSSASAAATSTLVKALTVVVGLGVASVGLFLALRPAPTPAPAAVAPSPTSPPVAPAPIDETPARVAAPVPHATPVKKPIVASRGAESLAQEVAILSRASADLHAGQPAAALAALDEHERRFPAGVLAQERTAAQAQALCALGRTKQARAALARLARTAPNSPHEARARKACDAVLTKGE